LKRGTFIGLAVLGLALSLWLEVLHVRAYLVPSRTSFCSVGQTLDCASVALSRFSVLLDVPVPLWGALGFLAIGIAAYQRSRWLVVLTGAAALASLVLLGVELFAVGALCLLCEAVHALCFALFALALRKRKELSVPLGSRDDALVLFGPPVGIAIALALYVPHYWGVFSWKTAPPFPHGTTADGRPWIGAKNPKITLEEITDYGCPHCKAIAARNLRRLAEHPDTLRIVRRQYPRFICVGSAQAACTFVRAAFCSAEQDKFWQADRFLFEHGTDRKRPTLATLAEGVGLDLAKLTKCSERPDIYERAEKETRLVVKQNVQDTPVLMIGGKRVSEETLNTLLRAR
jgi:uncharacterized membrane protein